MKKKNETLQRLIKDQAKIKELEKEIGEIRDEWWSFADKNRKAIKAAIYPIQNTIYELTQKAQKQINRYCDEDEAAFYVRVTSTRWGNIGYSFISGKEGVSLWPNVKGVLLDKDYQDKNNYSSDIPICYLGEKASKKKANEGKARPTFVYVMIDKNTGLYKIGRSVKPKARESTLQSEKPTIEMIFTYNAINKDEKYLHEMFKDKRYRGEWFSLDHLDLEKIKHYFETKKTFLGKQEREVEYWDRSRFIEKYRGESDQPNEATKQG